MLLKALRDHRHTHYENLLIQNHQAFFFFQAEDGIRDYKVTGVQTCALPISAAAAPRARRLLSASKYRTTRARDAPSAARTARSEERRVGKECRSRWLPY